MKTLLKLSVQVLLSLLFLLAASTTAFAERRAQSIESRTAEAAGVRFHYLSAGKGDALILLHGYAQTSHMWEKVMPKFAQRFRVIAPDLPGIGGSSIPRDGFDMKTAAIRIHALARELDITKARVVGHDIGLMVAYAYAAQFPTEVEKLVVMDAFLPGVGDWEKTYHNPALWHFFFNGPTAEALVKNRERVYLEHFWNDFAADKTRSLSEADRKSYATTYAGEGRMRAGWAYFAAFPQTAQHFVEFANDKLTMPVLAIAGEKAAGSALGAQLRLVASHVTTVVLKNTGHWLMEEELRGTTLALERFL